MCNAGKIGARNAPTAPIITSGIVLDPARSGPNIWGGHKGTTLVNSSENQKPRKGNKNATRQKRRKINELQSRYFTS